MKHTRTQSEFELEEKTLRSFIPLFRSYQFKGSFAMAGDLKIINNTSLRDVIAKGENQLDSKSINWEHSFKMIIDFVGDYARQWEMHEKEDVDTLSEWTKSEFIVKNQN